jgi:curved DNA-binding protein CbpA
MSGSNSNNDTSSISVEQVEILNRIKSARNYYEILGVEREANEVEIKRAYRKLALQFHPDKNKTDGAEEAFKSIGQAFGCLSDQEKRSRYDQYGVHVDLRQGQQHSSATHDFEFTTELTPEDIFNMFFGQHPLFSNMGSSSSHSSRHFYSMYHHHHPHSHHGPFVRRTTAYTTASSSRFGWFLQFLPLLLLLLFSSNWWGSDRQLTSSLFALEKTDQFAVERILTPTNFTYYVSDELVKSYGDRVHLWNQLEIKVKRTYHRVLEDQCQLQHTAKRQAMDRARFYGKKTKFEEASRRPLPACEQLYVFKRAYYGGKSVPNPTTK